MYIGTGSKFIIISSAVVAGSLMTWFLIKQKITQSPHDNSILIGKSYKPPLVYVEKADILKILSEIKENARPTLITITNTYKELRRKDLNQKLEYFDLVKKMNA